MNTLLEWREFRKTDVPIQDEETGDIVNEHELFCLWFLCQCRINEAVLETGTAVAIELASRITYEAPVFDDIEYIEFCLDRLEEKTLIARTKLKDYMYVH